MRRYHNGGAITFYTRERPNDKNGLLIGNLNGHYIATVYKKDIFKYFRIGRAKKFVRNEFKNPDRKQVIVRKRKWARG